MCQKGFYGLFKVCSEFVVDVMVDGFIGFEAQHGSVEHADGVELEISTHDGGGNQHEVDVLAEDAFFLTFTYDVFEVVEILFLYFEEGVELQFALVGRDLEMQDFVPIAVLGHALDVKFDELSQIFTKSNS